MKHLYAPLKPTAVAFLLFIWAASGLMAQTPQLDDLFERLETADAAQALRIQREIFNEWGQSGSPSMDRLLRKGQTALAQGDYAQAIDHLTALIDQAPDFAEGWNARATAYYHAGRFGPALADIAVTLSLNSRHFGALVGLGLIFEATDQGEKALLAYREALALNPHLESVAKSAQRLATKYEGQST